MPRQNPKREGPKDVMQVVQTTRLMRVSLDTSALNWFTDHPDDLDAFLAARAAGTIEVLVHIEAAYEIRKTKDAPRRAALERTLTNFFPLTPTRVARAGATAIAGMMRLAGPADLKQLSDVQFLKDGWDRHLITNAVRDGCDVFLTTDKEMYEQKLRQLVKASKGLRILTPSAFVAEVGLTRTEA